MQRDSAEGTTGFSATAAPAAGDTAAAFRFPDTDASEAAQPAKQDYPAVFSRHELTAENIQPVPRQHFNPDWFIFSLVLCIAYFTALKVFYPRVIKQLLNAFVSHTASNQAVRDENLLLQRISVLLSVLFYFAGGLFLYRLADYYGWENKYAGSGFLRFFLFSVMLATVFSVIMVIHKAAGIIFRADRLASSYIFNIFVINNVTGIFLLPVLSFAAFLPEQYAVNFLALGGIGAGILWLYRIIRGVAAWVSVPGSSLYYLILYLCAFEIAPLLILIKLA